MKNLWGDLIVTTDEVTEIIKDVGPSNDWLCLDWPISNVNCFPWWGLKQSHGTKQMEVFCLARIIFWSCLHPFWSMNKNHIWNWQNVPMEDSKTSILVLNNLLAAEIAPEDISHPCHGFSSGPPMAVFFTLLTRCIVPESNETSQSKWCGWTMLGMNMDSWKTILTISSTLIMSALIFSPATRSNVSTFCAGTVLQICELWHDQWNWLFKENAFFVGNTNIQKIFTFECLTS